jgi:alpha-glucoside transport system substrate-binding protein
VLRTDVQAASAPLFTDPAGCVLYRQASFALGWMPDGLEFGPEGDVDFFLLPGSVPGEEPPVVVGADLAVAFADRPEVQAVLAYLTTPAAGQPWAERGSYVSPRRTVDPTWYGNAADQRIAEVLLESRSLLFDASDAMPPEIGSGLLWELITQWVAGGVGFDEMAGSLDAAWTGPDPDAGIP